MGSCYINCSVGRRGCNGRLRKHLQIWSLSNIFDTLTVQSRLHAIFCLWCASGRRLSCSFNLAHGSARSPIGLFKKKGNRRFQSSAVCFSSKFEQNTLQLMGSSSCCQVCSYCALRPPPASFISSILLGSFLCPIGLLLMSNACPLGLSNTPLLCSPWESYCTLSDSQAGLSYIVCGKTCTVSSEWVISGLLCCF